MSVNIYTAEAIRWAKGWEVHIAGVGVTQSTTLAGAQQAARDYISSLYSLADDTDFEVVVEPRLGEITAMVRSAKAKRQKADEANSQAAAAIRAVAARLLAKGLSTADAATVLGVTKGRISQLTRTATSAPRSTTRLTNDTVAAPRSPTPRGSSSGGRGHE